nr:hypothetical protein [Tanacetum cinerariifolium]
DLGHGVDVFLAVAPAVFHLLDGDVGGDALGHAAHGAGQARLVSGLQLGAGEAEEGQQRVYLHPGGHGVVVTQAELVFLAGLGEAFEQAQLAIYAGQSAAAVLDAAG